MLIFWFRRRYAVEIHCVRQIGQHRQQIRDCHRSENEICRRDLHAKQSLSLQTKYLLTECELNFNTGRYLDHSWSISIKRIYVTTLNCANESSLRANLWIKFQTVSLWQFLGCRPIPTFLPLWMWKLVGDVHMVITSHVPSLKFIFIVVTILQARIRGGGEFSIFLLIFAWISQQCSAARQHQQSCHLANCCVYIQYIQGGPN